MGHGAWGKKKIVSEKNSKNLLLKMKSFCLCICDFSTLVKNSNNLFL